MAWVRNRNFESPFCDDIATQIYISDDGSWCTISDNESWYANSDNECVNESATVLILLKQWDRITDRDGVLYRRITMPNCDNERSRADDDWVEKHQRRLRDAHRMARVHLQQHADDRKQRYDRRAGDLPLAVGDRV